MFAGVRHPGEDPTDAIDDGPDLHGELPSEGAIEVRRGTTLLIDFIGAIDSVDTGTSKVEIVNPGGRENLLSI